VIRALRKNYGKVGCSILPFISIMNSLSVKLCTGVMIHTFRTLRGGHVQQNYPPQGCESVIKAKIVNELKILKAFLNSSPAYVFKTDGHEGSMCNP